jgi:hypothetical protein
MLKGAIIDRFRRPEPLDEREQAFADWAESRGLAVGFSRLYPDDGEPFLTYELFVEEMIGDKIHGYHMTVEPTEHQAQRDIYEQLLRAGFERYKEALPVDEHR